MTTSSRIELFKSADGQVHLDIKLEQDTVWLTQAQLAELFQVKPQNITMHLKKVFSDGELQEQATCKDFLQVQMEGGREVSRKRKFYNLDAIISVGYRVNRWQMADGNKRTGPSCFCGTCELINTCWQSRLSN